LRCCNWLQVSSKPVFSKRKAKAENKVRCQKSEYSTDVALIRLPSSASATLWRDRLIGGREKPSSQKEE
jgi:hypothetical protein